MSEQTAYPLHRAALDGDTDTLNRMLAEGALVDDRDTDGRTPLFCAARNGETIAAWRLLKHGARVDSEANSGATALMAAARGGHADLVRLLLASGADPNQVLHTQPPALPARMQEAQQKIKEARRTLHDLRSPSSPLLAEVNSGPRITSALIRGIMSRDLPTVVALLDANADVNFATGSTNLTPLGAAIKFGSLEIVRVVLNRGAKIDVKNADDASSIASAVLKQDVDVTRLLLDRGARPDSDALAFALVKNDIDMARLLLEHGADPDETFRNSTSIVVMAQEKPEIAALFAEHRGTNWHSAVTAGNLAEVRARLDAGADVNRRDGDGQTALMLAAKAGHEDIARLLLERGARLDASTEFQVTPLMMAAQQGHSGVSRRLLANGADVDAANKLGQTALYLACTQNQPEIQALLVDAGATVGIVEAALLGDRSRVMGFLAEGVSIDQANSAGLTAFIAAAAKGDIELLASLRDRGADISHRIPLGDSAFHHAIQHACGNGDTTVLALLLDWGMDVNAPGRGGFSPLRFAIMYGSETVAHFLLGRGANPNDKCGIAGDTLLTTAIRSGRGKLSIAGMLLDHGADVDANNKHGGTALMATVGLTPKMVSDEENNAQCIRTAARLLIDRGANVNAQDNIGTVLEHAVENGDLALVSLLIDAGANVNGSRHLNPLVRACMQGHADVAALLRERGASDRTPEDIEAGIPEGLASALMAVAVYPGGVKMLSERFDEARRKKKGGA